MSTIGVWRTSLGAQPVAVKRLAAPGEHDPAELSDPHHFAYWRRAADVVTSGILARTRGLRPPVRSVADEDVEGITLTEDWVEDAAVNGLFAAHALGRFAGTPVPDVAWLARDQLRDRLRRTAHRGGWPTLSRTTVADVAEHLWTRRDTFLDRCDALPQVLQHGDPTPGNLPGREGDDVVAIDWSCLGTAAVGADLVLARHGRGGGEAREGELQLLLHRLALEARELLGVAHVDVALLVGDGAVGGGVGALQAVGAVKLARGGLHGPLVAERALASTRLVVEAAGSACQARRHTLGREWMYGCVRVCECA